MNTPGQNKSIAILGAGGIGGFLAAIFWKHGFPVTCIAKPEAVEALKENGIRLKSRRFGDFAARPHIVSKLDSEPDILFIATKANNLKAALGSLPVALMLKAITVPFLNGFEHIDFLRRGVGFRVAVGMIGKIEAKKDGCCAIVHANDGAPEVEIASQDGVSRPILEYLAAMFRSVGLKANVFDRENEVIWRKLARLNAIACLTAVTNKPLGFIRSDPVLRSILETCLREGIAVAQADGVNLDFAKIMAEIDKMPETLTTSLQRDIANGLDSEVEAIPGAVIRRGGEHSIECRVIEALYNRLRS